MSEDPEAIDNSIKTILLLHSMIMSFGGMPLLYAGDSIGTLNDVSYLNDEFKNYDSRWTHRQTMDWERAERRNQPGSIEQRIFSALKKMIAIRKEIIAFADHNNRELLDIDNPHIFAFSRFNYVRDQSRVLVIGNFATTAQALELQYLRRLGFLPNDSVLDLHSGETLPLTGEHLVVPGLTFYWLLS